MIDHLSIDGQVINIVLWRNNLYQSITKGRLTLKLIFYILMFAINDLYEQQS